MIDHYIKTYTSNDVARPGGFPIDALQYLLQESISSSKINDNGILASWHAIFSELDDLNWIARTIKVPSEQQVTWFILANHEVIPTVAKKESLIGQI